MGNPKGWEKIRRDEWNNMYKDTTLKIIELYVGESPYMIKLSIDGIETFARDLDTYYDSYKEAKKEALEWMRRHTKGDISW